MREQSITVWLVLGAVLLMVLNLPAPISHQIKAGLREGIAPLQALLSGTGRDVKEVTRSLRGLGDLADQNRKLTAEIVELRNDVLQLRALERENIALREQLGFAQRAKPTLVPCEIIARDLSGWWQVLRVGKGSSHGIEPDQAVITSDGVLGKTIDVSLTTSDIMLLSDPSCKASARLSRTDAFGVVSGQGVSWSGQVILTMEFINKDISVKPGDEVVTSGLGGIFPKGLLIGYVEKVHVDRNGLYQTAEIFPKVDFGGVSYAFVVSREEDPVKALLEKKRRAGEQGL